MKFVLIFILATSDGSSIISQEFETLGLCNLAKTKLEAISESARHKQIGKGVCLKVTE